MASALSATVHLNYGTPYPNIVELKLILVTLKVISAWNGESCACTFCSAKYICIYLTFIFHVLFKCFIHCLCFVLLLCLILSFYFFPDYNGFHVFLYLTLVCLNAVFYVNDASCKVLYSANLCFTFKYNFLISLSVYFSH